jgi:maltose/moltooligosaccharide transporter
MSHGDVSNGPFPVGRAFVLGCGFLGIALVWPIFNTYVPIFLKQMGMSATLIGFVMTWDNYINLFLQPMVGERSDRTKTRIGRRKPWILAGAPLAVVAFAAVPRMSTALGITAAILATNLASRCFDPLQSRCSATSSRRGNEARPTESST